MARRVETALSPLRGESLLKVKGDDVTGLATALPYVAGVTYDRAFPNTLRVRVEAERPLAVVRHGIEAWIVSRRGRIMKRIPQRTHRALPRIWLDRSVDVTLGATLAAGGGGEDVAMLDALRGAKLARRIATVRNVGGQWVYVLRGGLELRVGTRVDVPLKLEIARRILQQTPVFGYLDVSVPERPVAQDNPQLSTEGRG
jgi:cell division septal protein FtsQ